MATTWHGGVLFSSDQLGKGSAQWCQHVAGIVDPLMSGCQRCVAAAEAVYGRCAESDAHTEAAVEAVVQVPVLCNVAVPKYQRPINHRQQG